MSYITVAHVFMTVLYCLVRLSYKCRIRWQAEEKEEMEEDRMAARKRKAEIAAGETPGPNFIRTSIYDKYVSGDLRSVIEITTNLDCPVT